jgi:hypothetical protein
MASTLNVTEYLEEGFALIEDTEGTYLASKHTDSIVDIPKVIPPVISTRNCILVQSREAMLT